ncbi:putative quinol monooxygenase [Halomarina oriensis]|uniref:ABM domain-containing protein n=1 Tax=Halomarina oriensis TaxID=671145 RepID=A0A6B0GP80_9EURY|nr:antibiotic biosynthesis monooxygenase [Halomarina oriensis]MWG36622.1 hypothetical protein [Halomarina oriensis]
MCGRATGAPRDACQAESRTLVRGTVECSLTDLRSRDGSVYTSIPLDPDRVGDALAIVDEVAAASRENAGTVRYHASRDVLDPSAVRLFEQDEAGAATRAHLETDDDRPFVERLPDLVDGTIETVQMALDEPPATARFDAEEAAESVE